METLLMNAMTGGKMIRNSVAFCCRFVLLLVPFLVLLMQCQTAESSELNNRTITAIPGVRVGHYTDVKSLKGCTVIRFSPEGATAAVDVRGAAPGTRETDLLDPVNMVDKVHAIVLSGGSAYGLDAASGVMACLEQDSVGLPVGNGIVVPIVPAAVLFDLGIGDGRTRPTARWGFQACQSATDAPVDMGVVGAGTGATVGKVAGMGRAMKSGLGSSLVVLPNGGLVGALIAVNALGDVIDPAAGKIIAGTRGNTRGTFHSSVDTVLKQSQADIFSGTNTTIGVVVTNIPLTKTQLKKIAQMAHDGMARAINPVHTMYDGDTLFAVSVPSQAKIRMPDASPDYVNLAGVAAAEATAQAIVNAVRHAASVEGYPSASDWTGAD